MAIYRGVGGVNREIKAQYRGVGGVNREIKEQWRGVGGVNRLVFTSHTKLFAITADTVVANSSLTAAESGLTIRAATATGKPSSPGRIVTGIDPSGAVSFSAGDILTVSVSHYSTSVNNNDFVCSVSAGGVTASLKSTGDHSLTCTSSGTGLSFELKTIVSLTSSSSVSLTITKICKNGAVIWLPEDNL